MLGHRDRRILRRTVTLRKTLRLASGSIRAQEPCDLLWARRSRQWEPGQSFRLVARSQCRSNRQVPDGVTDHSSVDRRRCLVARWLPTWERALASREPELTEYPNRPQRHRAAQSTKQGGVTGLIRIELAKLEKRRLSREYAPVFSEELGITGLVWIKTVWVLNGCRRLRPCERQGESTMAVTMAVRRISHAPPLNPDSPASTVCSSATGLEHRQT